MLIMDNSRIDEDKPNLDDRCAIIVIANKSRQKLPMQRFSLINYAAVITIPNKIQLIQFRKKSHRNRV